MGQAIRARENSCPGASDPPPPPKMSAALRFLSDLGNLRVQAHSPKTSRIRRC
jgi:hypothetical protein